MNKRRVERFNMDIPLTLKVHQWQGEGSFKGHEVKGILSDISREGIGIVSETPLALDMFVEITVPEEKTILPLIGRIIRVEIIEPNEKFRYGCILSGTSLGRQKRLEEYIEKRFKGVK